jgi:hypothetical protein
LKHTTLRHIKTMRLQQQLGLRLYEAVGLLELLFQRTAECAWFHGEIGSNRSNADIGLLLDYSGDPEELIAALVSAGYIDEHETFRLVVHDWRDHCPRFVLKRIGRAEQESSDTNVQQSPNGDRCPPSGGQTGIGIGTGAGVGTSRSVRFQRPTVDQVSKYCSENGHTFDPEAFHAHYESNGWQVGRSPMKDWKAACVTWQKRTEKNYGKRIKDRAPRIAKAKVIRRGAF